VSERDRYRCSFDAVAETYERGRPGYAPQAVEWIAERLPFADVLDLAAGTGKLTRQLVALGAHVIAVEPGDGMQRGARARRSRGDGSCRQRRGDPAPGCVG
jgi:predicted RNA methylase